MARGHLRASRNALLGLVAIFLVLGGVLAGSHTWSDAGLTPKLGLDLEGGTQLVLSPKLVGAQKVSQQQLNQARDIIVQRVDANGVAGAEVTTENGQNIVVSMPGTPDRATLDAVRKSSQMQFRGVLVAAPVAAPTPAPSGTATGTATPSGTATTPGSPATSSTTSGAKSVIPDSLRAATTPTPSPTATTPAGSAAAPTDPNSPAWVTPELQKELAAMTCAPAQLEDVVDDPAKPLVTCSTDKTEKYILGPVIVGGDSIGDASAGYQTSQSGATTQVVQISLTFTGKGKQVYADASKRMVLLPDPRNRMAATLDSQVIVAPAFNEAIPNGQASITGNFTIESARALAQQLKFGALPLSFNLETQTQISAILGVEQLRLGLLAGLAGLLLVVAYSLLQYRVLGLVTVASLIVAASLTYLTITVLGWSQNYRLDMAGVTGCIVAIGVTADSFIVYFERIRDEVREGRPLRSAVETGWARARRTIFAADGVNFLAAIVLYTLATANVRGFAFTLGLTTVIDLLVVTLFTHPTVTHLAGTEFFGGGHKWSGLSPDRLGAKIRYAGRGRIAMDPPAAPAAPARSTTGTEGAVL